MGKPKRVLERAGFLWLTVFVGCSPQSSPPAAAPPQSAASASATPTLPASASATPTPPATGITSSDSQPPPAPSPAGSGIAEGKLCGTRGVPGDCSEGLYCAYRSQCGATDSGGTCTKRPQACTREYMPVCGCNHQTYANKCEAAAAAASVAQAGECKAK